MLRKPGYGRILFEADSGASGGNAGTPDASSAVTPPSSGESDAVTFTEAQQKEINRLIGNARKEGRTAAEQAAAQVESDRQADAAREAAEAKGEFETVKQSLIGERDTAKAELVTATEQVTAYAAIVAEQVETLKQALPAELLADYPQDGTPLAQLQWLKDRQQVYEVAKTAAGVAPNVTRLAQTPQGQSAKPGDVTKEQQAAFDRQYARW